MSRELYFAGCTSWELIISRAVSVNKAARKCVFASGEACAHEAIKIAHLSLPCSKSGSFEAVQQCAPAPAAAIALHEKCRDNRPLMSRN
jgi:hypothetical protein